MNLLQRPHAGVPPEVATFAVVSERVKHGCSGGPATIARPQRPPPHGCCARNALGSGASLTRYDETAKSAAAPVPQRPEGQTWI